MGFLRLFTQDEAACKSGVADSFLSDGVTNIYIYSVLLQQQDRADRFVGASVKAGNASFIFRPFLLTGSFKGVSLSLSLEEDALQIANENKMENAGELTTIVQ